VVNVIFCDRAGILLVDGARCAKQDSMSSHVVLSGYLPECGGGGGGVGVVVGQ
jgi:hypothetical protein